MSYSTQCRNEVHGYKRFRRTSMYIEEKAQLVLNLNQVVSSMFPSEKSPQIVLEQLINLKRVVPYQFLLAIDADIEKIKILCKEDKEEFEKNASRTDLFPVCAIVRLMPAVYHSREFPYHINEAEAIAHTITYFCANRFRCAIHYPDVKTIYVEPNGDIETTYYPPDIVFGENSLIPSFEGSKEEVPSFTREDHYSFFRM